MSLTFETHSDLTPHQGKTLDALPRGWKVCGRIDSDLEVVMTMAPDPYDPPPRFVFVRDPHGAVWRIARDGELHELRPMRKQRRQVNILKAA